MATLSLGLLGPFVATLGDRPLTHFRTKSAQAILIHLACQPEPHRRESLMTLLWPDIPQKSAQTNLRQSLYQLRQLIPELPARDGGGSVPLLLADRQAVQINPKASYNVDVLTFTALLRGPQENWSEAVTLYRGDFLADFYLPDSSPFEEWASARRADLKRKALEALDALATAAMELNDLEPAERYARQQLVIDNLRERAHRQLMEILVLSGRRSQALSQYEQCRRLLVEELATEPSPKTKALYERIRSAELGTAFIRADRVRGYELKEELGAGAFGAVHRAYQTAVDREVAIKIILPQYANHPDFIRRFEAEAQTVARLEHPHIVPLYDYWREPDRAFLVMRYLRGGSLQSSLRHGAWELEAATQLIDQIAGALAIAHRQGVVHRDIKPANILLDEEGHGYLSDFGIAKDVTLDAGLTATGAMLGSPAYLSPEQALNEEITPLTDIYSLGVVLYELLTGQHPFPDASMAALLSKHLNDPLPLVKEQRPEISDTIDDVIQRATAKDPAGRFADVLALAAAFKQATSGVEVIEVIPEGELVNPYKGLRPFQEADAADFFGREALIDELLRSQAFSTGDIPQLTFDKSQASRFLALVGPSGSGKSSVVKAGLLPALRQGSLAGSEHWFIVEMMPGTHPLEELEAGLLRIAVNPPTSLLSQMKEDERGLVRAVKRVLPDDEEGELLLVVDQFEELFTLVEEREERAHFLDSLYAAVTDARSRVRLLLTLRADFYDQPLMIPDFSELMRRHTAAIVPMTAEELSRAIVVPAGNVGVEVEPELLAAMVNDVSEQPGTLPLLQYALTELFERRDGRTMTLSAYVEMGGVLGALGRRAEEIYAGLDAAGREATRQMFLRLVTLGEGVEDTRRRVLRSELEALHPSEGFEPSEGLVAAIAAFGRYRLLTFDRDPATRGPTVEVAHEALLREWGRLRGWLEESRDDVRWQRRLAGVTAEWLAAHRDEGYLLRGSRLEQFAGWAADASIALTQDEQDFLEAGVKAREARQAEEGARRRRELETAQKLAETERRRAEEQAQAAQTLRRRAIYLGAALVIAAILAVTAILAGIQSSNNAERAITNANSAATQEAIAAAKAAEAEANALQAATAEASEAEQRRLAEQERDAAEAEANARATAEAIANQERESAETQRELAQVSEREALEAFSLSLAANARQALADDQQLALLLALAANQIENPPLWSWQTLVDIAYSPGQVRQMVPDDLHRVKVSPDGARLVTSHSSGIILVWDAQSGDILQRLEGHTGNSWGIDIGTDGRFLVSGGFDQQAILWDLESGEIVRQLTDLTGNVRSLAITPDGRRALLGVGSGLAPAELIVWDLASGEVIRRFGDDDDEEGPQEGVRGVAIAPDGRTALIGIGNATEQSNANPRPLMLWDMETGQVIRYFEDVVRSVNGVDISPDGRLGMAASADAFIYVVDLETGELVHKLEGHDIGGLAVAFSPDGRTAVSGAVDQQVIWWDIATGEILNQFQEDTGPIYHIEFVDNTRAVSAALGGSLRIWDLTNHWQLDRWGAEGDGHQVDEQIYERDLLTDIFAVHSLAISPDGQLALSGGGVEPDLLLWDYETGSLLKRLEGHTGAINDIAFTPDSRQALSASRDGTLTLWDLQNGSQVRQLVGHKSPVLTVAVSSNGRYAISGDEGNQIIYWDLASGELIQYLSGHMYGTAHTGVTDILFLYGDQQAVSSGKDSTLILWDLSSGQQVRRLTGFSGDAGHHWGGGGGSATTISLSPDGRQIFASGWEPWLLLWDLASGKSVRRYDSSGIGIKASFTPDGSKALSSIWNDALVLWDIETSRPIRQYPINNRLQSSFMSTFDIHPSGQTALSTEPDGTVIKWQLAEPTPAELLNWLEANRLLRELTCPERETFQIEPLCVDGKAVSTSADLLATVKEATASLSLEPGSTINESEVAALNLTPPAYPEYPAVIGHNRGELDRYQIDVWTLEGKAGELLSVKMEADNPAPFGENIGVPNIYELGLLAPYLLIIAPDGSQLVYADVYTSEDGSRIPIGRLDHVLLPQDGTYRIEARSFLDDSAGGYTLTVGLGQPIVVAPDILEAYTGTYLESARQSEILIYVEDGRLHYQCLPCVDAGDTQVLVPVSDTEFALIDDSRIVFTHDESGTVDGYDLWYAEAGWRSKTWHRAERIED